jgi:hypothetical protein
MFELPFTKQFRHMDQPTRPLWRLLFLTRDSKDFIQLTCEECFTLLEYDADLLVAGATLEEMHPYVVHHLSLCPECQTKLDIWLETLAGDAKSQDVHDQEN